MVPKVFDLTWCKLRGDAAYSWSLCRENQGLGSCSFVEMAKYPNVAVRASLNAFGPGFKMGMRQGLCCNHVSVWPHSENIFQSEQITIQTWQLTTALPSDLLRSKLTL